ncbi:MAG: hypothetical protein H0W73_15345 [Bacteroidetes bacterium]|nr:hypothetical protein [Bacteroidota bacterium]
MSYLSPNYLITKLKEYKIENILFYSLIIYSVALIWKYDFYLTTDGPAHVYNSKLLNLLNTSDFINQYFEKNSLVLPNYTDHIILQYLLKFFSTLTAHKIFLSMLVIFLPLTFRYSIKCISNKAGNFSIIIFPLLFNSLLHFGFYNFNLAFIFLNLQVAFTVLILNNAKRNYLFLVLFVINSVVLFYTHGFVFLITLVIVFLLVLIKEQLNFKALLAKGFLLLGLLLPSLILFFLFNGRFNVPDYDYDLSNTEKFQNIVSFSPAIVFTPMGESIYSSLIAIASIILITYILIKKSEAFKLELSDIFFLLSCITLPILVYTKNGMLSGMLSIRLIHIFYYFLFFWIASKAIHNSFIKIITVFMILFSFINLSEIRNAMLSISANDVNSVIKSADHIKDKSVVYTVNLIEYHDTYLHFSNCLAFNKEIIVSENYEAELGWFPVKWKKNMKPISCELHNKDIQVPDYVFICGEYRLINNAAHSIVKMFIDSACTNTYNSPNGLIKIFTVNKIKAQ